MADRVVIYHDLDGDDPEFDFHVTHLSGTPITGTERDEVLARVRRALIADEVDQDAAIGRWVRAGGQYTPIPDEVDEVQDT